MMGVLLAFPCVLYLRPLPFNSFHCYATLSDIFVQRLHREERLPPVVFLNLVVLVIGSSFLPLELITPRMTFLGFIACEPNLLSSIDVSRVTTLSCARTRASFPLLS